MANVYLREWDSNPQISENLTIETKLSDLGNPVYKKNILGYILSISQQTKYQTTTPGIFAFYSIDLFFRTKQGPGNPWFNLGNVSNVINANQFNTQGDYNKPVMLGTSIPVQNVQLKIKSIKMQGDIRINDFGLIYREIKSVSVEEHDE